MLPTFFTMPSKNAKLHKTNCCYNSAFNFTKSCGRKGESQVSKSESQHMLTSFPAHSVSCLVSIPMPTERDTFQVLKMCSSLYSEKLLFQKEIKVSNTCQIDNFHITWNHFCLRWDHEHFCWHQSLHFPFHAWWPSQWPLQFRSKLHSQKQLRQAQE